MEVRPYTLLAWLIAIALAGWAAARLLAGDLFGLAVLAGAAAAIAVFIAAMDVQPVFHLVAALTAVW